MVPFVTSRKELGTCEDKSIGTREDNRCETAKHRGRTRDARGTAQERKKIRRLFIKSLVKLL